MTLEQKLGAVFATALALVAAGVLFAWQSSNRNAQASAAVAHLLEVQAELRATTLGLVDLETGQRGFVLTGHETYLEPYERARTNLPVQLQRLPQAVTQSPAQRARLVELGRLVDDSLRHRARAVAVRRAEGQESAEALIQGGQGKALTDAARKVLADMQHEEEQQQGVAQQAAETASRRLLTALITLTGLVALVLGFGWREARYHLSQRIRAEDERDRFFDQSPDMHCIAGPDGYFKRVNPAFTATLGWSAAEMLAKPFLDFVHPNDRAATIQKYNSQAAGQSVLWFDNRYLCKDGSYRQLSWKATPLLSGLIYASARDVTELRAAQEQIRQSEERLRVTLHSIGDAVLATDTEGRVTGLNPVAEKLTGWTEAEAKGRPVEEVFRIVNEETRQPAVVPVEKVLATGLVVGLANHTALISRDGTERPIADSAAPIRGSTGEVRGVVLVFRDVTEERRAQQTLRNLLREARAIVMHATVTAPAGWDQHPPEWGAEQYRWESRFEDDASAQEVLPLALGPGEQFSHGWARAKLRDDWKPMNLVAARAFVSGAPTWHQEFRAADKHGKLHWFMQTALVQPDGPGRWQVTTINTDITARKMAAEALRTSEENLHVTLHSIGDAVLATDTEGRVTRLNPVAEKLTGWTEAEARGRPVEEVFRIVNEHTRQPAVIPVAKVLATGAIVGLANHTALIARDGTESPIADSAAPIRDREGRVLGVVLVFRDVSSERQAEVKLEQAREYAENIVQTVREPLLILDGDLRIRSANRAFYLMFEVKPEETEGRLLYEWGLRQWDIPELRARLARIIPDEAAFGDFEVDATFPTIGRRILHLSASKIYRIGNNTKLILLALRDVSARKQGEIALREINETLEERVRSRTAQLEELNRLLRLSDFSMNHASVGIFWANSDGRITRVNQAYCAMLGYTEAELLGMGISDVNRNFPPDVWAAHYQELREKKYLRLNTQLRRKDGQLITVEIARNWLMFDGQEFIVCFVHDISERLNHERQMLRSQRMESIGALAGGIAHDLNNALAPVMMGLSLMRDHARSDDVPMLDMMEASARRGADMVRQLLTFGKGIEGRRLLIQMRHLVVEMEKIIRGTFPKNILLQVNAPRGLDAVLGDPTQLHQVLLNLCVNARDAMPNGGTLTLEAGIVVVDETYAATAPGAKPGKYVVCRVSDTGEGIPPEILERIFEPFFTTKSPDKGTGLGLSTAVGIVRSHGGFIQVQSKPGRGSTFSIHLPAQHGTSDTERISRLPLEFRGHGELILVVEDDQPVRRVACALLERLNFKVAVASDGTEALVRAAEHRDSLCVVLTDLHMPHMDGLVFARALKRMVPRAALIVMSGHLEEHQEQEFKRLGAVAFLTKPFTQEKLVEALQLAFAPNEPHH